MKTKNTPNSPAMERSIAHQFVAPTNKPTRAFAGRAAMIAAAGLFFTSGANAATLGWVASPADNNLANSANWTPSQAPANLDSFNFGASSITTLNNNTTASNRYSFTFLAGAPAYTIGGNAIRMETTTAGPRGIINNSSNLQTINFNSVFGWFTTTAGGGDILFTGNQTASAGTFSIEGTGVTTLAGDNTATTAQIGLNADTTLRVSTAQNLNSGAIRFLQNGATLELRNDSSTDFSTNANSSIAINANNATVHVNQAVGGTGVNGTMTLGNLVSGGSHLNRTFRVTGDNGYGLTIGSFTTASSVSGRTKEFINDAPGLFTVSGNMNLSTHPATTANSTLRFDGAGDSLVQGNIIVTEPEPTSGNYFLVKQGVGTLTVDGDSDHKLETTVSVGTLIVNGNFTGTGAVTVASNAVLGGEGSLAGATSISGSLRPGNSIGTLTINNNVTWNEGQAWVFELGTSADTLALAGSGSSTQDLLLINGGNFTRGTGTDFVFNFANTGAIGWYRLVDWTGTSNFIVDDFDYTGLTAGRTATFEINGSALYVNVIPEPSTWILTAIGLGILVFRRKLARFKA